MVEKPKDVDLEGPVPPFVPLDQLLQISEGMVTNKFHNISTHTLMTESEGTFKTNVTCILSEKAEGKNRIYIFFLRLV